MKGQSEMSFLGDLAKPLIEAWLRGRALKLPAKNAAAIAKKVSTKSNPITPEQVQAVCDQAADYAITQIDKIKL